jgi:hypothetical protein
MPMSHRPDLLTPPRTSLAPLASATVFALGGRALVPAAASGTSDTDAGSARPAASAAALDQALKAPPVRQGV